MLYVLPISADQIRQSCVRRKAHVAGEVVRSAAYDVTITCCTCCTSLYRGKTFYIMT